MYVCVRVCVRVRERSHISFFSLSISGWLQPNEHVCGCVVEKEKEKRKNLHWPKTATLSPVV